MHEQAGKSCNSSGSNSSDVSLATRQAQEVASHTSEQPKSSQIEINLSSDDTDDEIVEITQNHPREVQGGLQQMLPSFNETFSSCPIQHRQREVQSDQQQMRPISDQGVVPSLDVSQETLHTILGTTLNSEVSRTCNPPQGTSRELLHNSQELRPLFNPRMTSTSQTQEVNLDPSRTLIAPLIKIDDKISDIDIETTESRLSTEKSQNIEIRKEYTSRWLEMLTVPQDDESSDIDLGITDPSNPTTEKCLKSIKTHKEISSKQSSAPTTQQKIIGDESADTDEVIEEITDPYFKGSLKSTSPHPDVLKKEGAMKAMISHNTSPSVVGNHRQILVGPSNTRLSHQVSSPKLDATKTPYIEIDLLSDDTDEEIIEILPKHHKKM